MNTNTKIALLPGSPPFCRLTFQKAAMENINRLSANYLEGLQLKPGSALKVPLAELPDTKENIRSAPRPRPKQQQIDVATSSDEHYLYV